MISAMTMLEQSHGEALQLDLLNPEQYAAVTHRDGPLLVIAGPGSGKTRVITHRIAWLIEQGVVPWRILAVTFTNRAAKEMTSRLQSLVSSEDDQIWAGTFHSTCARMLRRHGREIGVPNSFVIYDSDEQTQVVRGVSKALGIDPKQYPPRMLLSSISRYKSQGTTLEDFVGSAQSYYEEIVLRVWERYAEQLLQNSALDFDDLLLRTLEMFNEPVVREHYSDRFDHVLVDEFQDTSTVQYELARAWSAGRRNLTVVGDPDQSIYSWRSADIRNLKYFLRDHPNATEVQLNTNYRSSQQILDVANAVINRSQDRIERSLNTENEDGPKPRVLEVYNESDEAEHVTSYVLQGYRDGALQFGDVAVLFRTNAQSRAIEESLVQHAIPYRLIGATRFYDRREIRDLIAYLRLLRNPSDSLALARVINVPTRGIGARTVGVLQEWAEINGRSTFDAAAAFPGDQHAIGGFVEPPAVTRRAANSLRQFADMIRSGQAEAARAPLAEVLRHLLGQLDYRAWLQRQAESPEEAESRWENVQELVTVAEGYAEVAPGAALDAFLEDVALIADIDDLPEGQPDAVTLITLHSAKGLEFPVVFMVGMEEGLLPHGLSIDDPDRLEEERRLCYVGMTRAMRELHLLYAFRRSFQGRSGHNPMSRYLKDVNEELVQQRQQARAPVGSDVRPARNRTVRWEDFDDVVEEAPPSIGVQRGDRVMHEALGVGRVLEIREVRGDVEVTVRFEDSSSRRFLASVTQLSRV